jgi:replication initiation protein RepC
MHSGIVTTPFGRRQSIYAALQRDALAQQSAPIASIDKWTLFKTVSDARQRLGLQDRSLTVLHALLSFHPGNDLCAGKQLIVFPSNIQLISRAHGMAGATLRRHLAFLIDIGLIKRRDSANGKRYARKDQRGTVEQAFGFDLSPLLMRAAELATLAHEVVAERNQLRSLREDITIRRRDIRKVVMAAIEARAPGPWHSIQDIYEQIVTTLPRRADLAILRTIAIELDALYESMINLMRSQGNVETMSANAACHERHIEESKSESILESEHPELSTAEMEWNERSKPRNFDRTRGRSTQAEVFPLDLIVRACPEIASYAHSGKIRSNEDLTQAAHLARSCLNIAPATYQRAVVALGEQGAAIATACILGRALHIQSPGAYLQSLASKAANGQLSLAPILFARLRSAEVALPVTASMKGPDDTASTPAPSDRLIRSLNSIGRLQTGIPPRRSDPLVLNSRA